MNIFREEKGIPLQSQSSSFAVTAPGTINPLNGTLFSPNYQNLLKKRILLPVFEYRADFMRLLAEHQCIVLVGETGSGKTTQIPQWAVDYARSM